MLAASRRVLFVGDFKGQVGRRIREAGCGLAFPVGAHAEIAAHRRQPALVAWRDLLTGMQE